MDPQAYRKQVEQEVEAARASKKTRRRAGRNTEVAFSGTEAAFSGPEAIRELGAQAVEDDAVFSGLLKQLGDASTDSATRAAIVDTIQGNSFASNKFAALRPRWLAALRALVQDKDTELRLRALSLLSNENDGHTQELLLSGLRDPKQALVSPEAALGLLSGDVHAEVVPLARALADKPPSPAARLEALRVLGGDADSVPLFTRILQDRQESPEARRLAVSSLSALAPDRLRKQASEVVMADDEHPDVVAFSLTALALHPNALSSTIRTPAAISAMPRPSAW